MQALRTIETERYGKLCDTSLHKYRIPTAQGGNYLRDWIKILDEIDRDCVYRYEYLLGRKLTGYDEYSAIDKQIGEMILEWQDRKEFFEAYPEMQRYKEIPSQTREEDTGEAPRAYNSHKWYVEIVRDRAGTYYANMVQGNTLLSDLPKHISYNTLKSAILEKAGVTLPRKKELIFQEYEGKKYAYIDGTTDPRGIPIDLDRVRRGWRPARDPLPGTIPNGPIYIPPRKTFVNPHILVGHITDYKPEIFGEQCAWAPTVTIRLSHELYPDGTQKQIDRTTEYYARNILYTTSLDEAQERMAALLADIETVKRFPLIKTDLNVETLSAREYFSLLDIASLTDKELLQAKEFAKKFVGPQSSVVTDTNTEMIRRFTQHIRGIEPAQSFTDRLSSAISRSQTTQSYGLADAMRKETERG